MGLKFSDRPFEADYFSKFCTSCELHLVAQCIVCGRGRDVVLEVMLSLYFVGCGATEAGDFQNRPKSEAHPASVPKNIGNTYIIDNENVGNC